MRGCVKAVFVLLVLSFPIHASAQCSWVPRFSGQFRTTALDVAVQGGFVWVATGYGVQLLADGRIVDSVPLPGTTRVIAVDTNGYAYAGSGDDLVVLRRDGSTIHVVRSLKAGGTVHDIVLASWLFVATSNGIEHYALFDPANPSRTAAVLPTSSPTVMSLAVDRTTLYAADTDATVERFSIAIPSLPQPIGSLATLPRATAVNASPDGLVFVSDAFGHNTEVFSSGGRLARLSLGTNAFAGSASGTHFVAGPDRTLRAIDLSTPGVLTELLELQLAPTDGTDNVIHSMTRVGDTVYIAAGDIGLLTLDASRLASPWPLVSYGSGMTNGVRTNGAKAWFSNVDGRISEQNVVTGGLSLLEARNWNASPGSIVRDLRGSRLLTTSGSTATVWELSGTTPAAILTRTLPSAIRAAVLTDVAIIALLDDGSAWNEPITEASGRTTVANTALLARAGDAVARAEVRAAEGKTILHYYANGNLASEPRQFTVDGAATGSIALDATRAALFTFRGITVIDLASGATRVIADSNRVIPRQFLFSGDDLLVLDTRSLLVYDGARTLVREHVLPADAVAFDATPSTATIATTEGMAAISYLRELPGTARSYSSSFYSKVVAGGDRIWLQQKDGVDGFTLTAGEAPRFSSGVRAGGIVDIAASSSALFTVAGNGTVTAWSRAGAQLAQTTVSEGFDSRPLAIRTAGNAVWVALSTGCASGGCQQKTFVLDPSTLAVTATLTGGVRDVAVSGNRGFALFDMPADVRAFDLADPLRPSQTASVAAPAEATSIAWSSGSVHVAADRVHSYSDSNLAATAQRLTPVDPADAQQIRIAGGCAVISGRSEHPELYALPSWSGSTQQVPSAVRSMAMLDGRLVLLTGHSLEIWSTSPAAAPSRRRAIQ